MLKDVNNVISIPTKLDASFFRTWLEIMKPFHKLAPREMDVLAELLLNRLELSKGITDSNLLERIALSTDSREKVRAKLGMAPEHFQVIMHKFRKTGAIIDDKINPKLIPNYTKDSTGDFKLLFILTI